MKKLVKIQKVQVNLEIEAETFNDAVKDLEIKVLQGDGNKYNLWKGGTIYMGETTREVDQH